MAASISQSPNIALIYDFNHSDLKEQAIANRFTQMDPNKKMVFFDENRSIESEPLNQYSVELLSKDNNISTATACRLLIAHILCGNNPDFLSSILSTIYTDSYLKTLFTGKHFEKYEPNNYGLNTSVEWSKLCKENMTEKERMAIENVMGLFKLLDEQLPKQPSFSEKEEFLEGHMAVATNAMVTNPALFDIAIFAPISEALAFIKIKKVNEKLGVQADPSKELSLSMINRLYDKENVGKLLSELNDKYRTQFQVEKVTKVVEKILKAPNADPNTVFVVRVGEQHRDMTHMLLEHFKSGNIKEISLSREDLAHVEQKIQDQFLLETTALAHQGDTAIRDSNTNSV